MADTTTRVFCPECEREFAAGHEICPEDGTSLMAYEVVDVDDSEDPLVGEVLDGRFRIEEPLSQGGMGKVYLGAQMGVDRDVAVKVLHSELVDNETVIKRFLREARTISDFAHPNIVNFVDFGQEADRQVLYLVMELIDGVELGDLLARGRLRADFAVEVAIQVCSALSEPHHSGVVHRDLKPANLMLLPLMDGSMQVKVVDFGIANAVQSQTRLTQTGAVCGTPHYMAPEQARGNDAGRATDIYALGAILFHMVTGEPMYDAEKSLNVMFKHANDPAPELRSYRPEDPLPEGLVELYGRMVAKEPEERPDSVLEVRDELEAIQQASGFDPIRVDPEEPTETIFDDWLSAGRPAGAALEAPPETGAEAAPNRTADRRVADGAEARHEEGGEAVGMAETIGAEEGRSSAGGAGATPTGEATSTGVPSEEGAPVPTAETAPREDEEEGPAHMLLVGVLGGLSLAALGVGAAIFFLQVGDGGDGEPAAGGAAPPADVGAETHDGPRVDGGDEGGAESAGGREDGSSDWRDTDGPDSAARRERGDAAEGRDTSSAPVVERASDDAEASPEPADEARGADRGAGSGDSPERGDRAGAPSGSRAEGSRSAGGGASSEREDGETSGAETRAEGNRPDDGANSGLDEDDETSSGTTSEEDGDDEEFELKPVPSESAGESEQDQQKETKETNEKRERDEDFELEAVE